MPKLLKSSVQLSEKCRERVVVLLNAQVANLLDLQSQLKQAHWNVRGPHFYSYHKLFEDLAQSLDEHIDSLAERATALGGAVTGSLKLVAEKSTLKALPLSVAKDSALLQELQSRFKSAAASCRSALDEVDELDDDGTEDLLIGLSQQLDKGVWFIDASLNR